MVPADDEQQSESTAPQITAGNKPPTAPTDSSPRLTPMPPSMMHWWLPLLLALILLAAGCFLASIWRMPLKPFSWESIKPFWPPSWPFNYHWPSKDAMALCVTIAGAGFAFSAWQQRSHDNAANAKQAQATVEREDYWKRREHIFQLLGSKNPGLRLGAVALLAELADSAHHSIFLNETEKQQLQHHIINTMCLQMRREGSCLKAEGTKEEHQQIQTAILQALFERINEYPKDPNLADWSQRLIFMTDTHFIAPFEMTQVTTNAKFILNGSTFRNNFTIFESELKSQLHTDNTTFLSKLTIFKSRISIFQLPLSTTKTNYTQSRIAYDGNGRAINIKLANRKQQLIISECDIFTSRCECDHSCSCKRSKSKVCSCETSLVCSCKRTCAHAKLSISCEPQKNLRTNQERRTPELTILSCRTGSIRIAAPASQFQAYLSHNTIYGSLEVQFQEASENNSEHPHFIARYNRIAFTKTTRPITLTNRSNIPLTELCTFENNFTFFKTDNSDQVSKLQSRHISKHRNVIHFQFRHSFGDKLHTFSWDEGRFIGIKSEFLCEFQPKHDDFLITTPMSLEDSKYIEYAYSKSILDSAKNGTVVEWSKPGIAHICNSEHCDQIYIVTERIKPETSRVRNSTSDETEAINSDPFYWASFTLGTSMWINSETFIGEWRSNHSYYFIHHLAIPWSRPGIARTIFEFAANMSPYLRCVIDETNYPMRHALESFGFKKCGTVTLQNLEKSNYDTKPTRSSKFQLIRLHFRLPLSSFGKQTDTSKMNHTAPKMIAYDWIKEPDPQEHESSTTNSYLELLLQSLPPLRTTEPSS
jgi:acetyltransferase, GNAT family